MQAYRSETQTPGSGTQMPLIQDDTESLLAPLLLDPQIYFVFELSVVYQILLSQWCSASNTRQNLYQMLLRAHKCLLELHTNSIAGQLSLANQGHRQEF